MAKFLLAAIATGYIFISTKKVTATKWFAAYLLGYTILDFFAFIRVSLPEPWAYPALPVQYIASIFFSFCYVQFAYTLKTDQFKQERVRVMFFTGLIGAVTIIFGIQQMWVHGFNSDYTIVQILLPYSLFMIIWSAVIFHRKNQLQKNKLRNTEAYFAGYSYFFWLTIMAICISIVTGFRAMEIIDYRLFTILFFILNLTLFAVLTASFLKYVVLHSPLLTKLVGVSLVLFLAIIGIQGFLILSNQFPDISSHNAEVIHNAVVPYALSLIVSCVVIVLVFPVFHMKVVAQPLQNIIEGMDEINRGNLTYSIISKSMDELGSVSNHFNTMAGNLKLANDELKTYTESLEQKVNERTFELQTANELLLQQTEELERMQEFRARLFQDISHELRTPITLIAGPLHQLLMQSDLSESARKQLLLSIRNSDRLKELVEQIIELNRLESNQMVFRGEAIDIIGKLNVLI